MQGTISVSTRMSEVAYNKKRYVQISNPPRLSVARLADLPHLDGVPATYLNVRSRRTRRGIKRLTQ
jgi:hypothetical protein